MKVNFSNDQFSISEISKDEAEIFMNSLAQYKNSLNQQNKDADSSQKEQIRIDKQLTNTMFRKIESCYTINLTDVDPIDTTPYSEEVHR